MELKRPAVRKADEAGWFPQVDMARIFAVSLPVWQRSWLPKVPANARREVSGRLYVHARRFIDFLIESARREALGPDGELLAGGDSPALERFRLAKARLAELELQRQQENLLPREAVHRAFEQIASILRTAGEQLQRLYGEGPYEILISALEDAENRFRAEL